MSSPTRGRNPSCSSSSPWRTGVVKCKTTYSKPSSGKTRTPLQATIFSRETPGSSPPLPPRNGKRNVAGLVERFRKIQIDQVERRLVVRVLRRDVVQRFVLDPIRKR